VDICGSEFLYGELELLTLALFTIGFVFSMQH